MTLCIVIAPSSSLITFLRPPDWKRSPPGRAFCLCQQWAPGHLNDITAGFQFSYLYTYTMLFNRERKKAIFSSKNYLSKTILSYFGFHLKATLILC